jgi:putative ABC transport system permease protein
MFQIPSEADDYDNMIVSVETTDFEHAVADFEKIWKAQVNNTPFEYSFLDDNIRKQYDEDKRVSGIITGFTCIAVLISCLGLYGLSTYMAERRFKEIGVRKVMGASVGQIVGLMSSEFIRLVIIAMIISVPLAWYAMDNWLKTFASHIPVDALVFVYAGGAALIIAMITISFESMRAAAGNPLNALRSE